MSTNLLSKKVVIVAIIAAGAMAAVLFVPPVVQAAAQQQQQKMMTWTGEGEPQINGSVSVANETSNFISENAGSFVTAAETAQGQVDNGRVLGGHLSVVQGYLVYTFFVANTTNQTGHMVIVDAGNGEVLYTSEGHALGSFGPMSGQWGGHGYGGLHGGPWRGHNWGMWH